MGKYRDFVRYMLMWAGAFVRGMWEVALRFAKKHPVLTFFFIWLSLTNPILGLCALAIALVIWAAR